LQKIIVSAPVDGVDVRLMQRAAAGEKEGMKGRFSGIGNMRNEVKGRKKTTRRQIMKRSMYRFARSTTVLVAAVLFCMTVIFGSPLISKAQTGTAAPKPKTSETDRVEARINDLHSKLKITPAQEEQWNKVAEVMRENAAAMEPLVKARQEKAKTMNAVEDLKSYAQIANTHAAGLNKFISVFEVLYASMSDEQKKIADSLFTKHDHKKRLKKK
jgi:hypothetical protein